MKDKGEAKKSTEKITIPVPNFKAIRLRLQGTSPLVLHRFDEKAKAALRITTQEKADLKKERGARTAASNKKEAEDAFNAARYISEDGWDGISCGAFRNALIDACRLTGLPMTRARMAVFIDQDGYDARDHTPLVKIEGEARIYESVGRTSGMNQGPILQFRPMFHPWSVVLRIRYDADLLESQSVFNLIHRAGIQIGVGEGRPFSKKSNGLGFGLFIPSKEEVEE